MNSNHGWLGQNTNWPWKAVFRLVLRSAPHLVFWNFFVLAILRYTCTTSKADFTSGAIGPVCWVLLATLGQQDWALVDVDLWHRREFMSSPLQFSPAPMYNRGNLSVQFNKKMVNSKWAKYPELESFAKGGQITRTYVLITDEPMKLQCNLWQAVTSVYQLMFMCISGSFRHLNNVTINCGGITVLSEIMPNPLFGQITGIWNIH